MIAGALAAIGIALLGAGAIPALRPRAGPLAAIGSGILIATTILSAWYVARPNMQIFELRVRQGEAPRLLDCLARHPACPADAWTDADALRARCPEAACLSPAPGEAVGGAGRAGPAAWRPLLRRIRYADGTPGWIAAGNLFDDAMPNDVWVKRGDAAPVACLDSVMARRPRPRSEARTAACDALPLDALPIRAAARSGREDAPPEDPP